MFWRNHDPVTELLRRGVLVTDGDEHDRYRKLMEPSLHPSQLDGYTQIMLAKTERATATWGDLLLLFVNWHENDRPTPGFNVSKIWQGILIHIVLALI